MILLAVMMMTSLILKITIHSIEFLFYWMFEMHDIVVYTQEPVNLYNTSMYLEQKAVGMGSITTKYMSVSQE